MYLKLKIETQEQRQSTPFMFFTFLYEHIHSTLKCHSFITNFKNLSSGWVTEPNCVVY